jgi:hypothetical protein
MAARGWDGSANKTPERVVELLQKAVKESSQSAVAKATGLRLYSIQRYLKGLGDPTTDTLAKLAAYFNVSVTWLRGDGVNPLDNGTMKGSCSRCGGEVMLHPDRGESGDSTLVITVHPCETCCKG